MTKENGFSESMNNSSALIAPSRSEIRIELPTIAFPSWKAILNAACIGCQKIAHKVSLCSVFAISSIRFFGLNISLPAMVILSVVAMFSSIASFFIIYREVANEPE